MGEIRSGEYFYSLDPSKDRTFLVQYRENELSGKDSAFWKANTIHAPILLYKDWYQVRDEKKDFRASSFELPFMEIYALPVPSRVMLGASLKLLFISREVKRVEKINISVDGEFICSYDANFSESSSAVVDFIPKEEGHYLVYRESNGRRIILVQFDCERKPAPIMALERSASLLNSEFIPFSSDLRSYEKRVDPKEEESLYFSLKDVMDPAEYESFDFSIYEKEKESRSFGMTRLLNTIKHLPKQEELKLIQDLFQDDFELGLYFLEHYFPYDLVFYLKTGVLGEILASAQALLVNTLLRHEDKFRKEKILAALDPVRARQMEALSSVVVQESELVKARKSFLSYCRAFLQQQFGVIICTRKTEQDFYVPSSQHFPGCGIRRWSVGGRTAFLDYVETGKFRSPEHFVMNMITDETPFCGIPLISKGKLLLTFFSDFGLVQVVKDGFGLTREEISEFRNVRAGTGVLLSCESRSVRLKVGGLNRFGLKEMMLDVIVCGTLGAEIIMDTGSEDAAIPVRLLKADSRSEALLVSYSFSSELLIQQNGFKSIRSSEDDLFMEGQVFPLNYHLYFDTGRMAATSEVHRNKMRLSMRQAIQPSILASDLHFPVTLYTVGFQDAKTNDVGGIAHLLDMLYSESSTRYLRSRNIIYTADQTAILYQLTVLTAEPGNKEKMDASLKKLNTLVRTASVLELSERLHVYFRLKGLFEASPSYLKFWIDSMAHLLFEDPVDDDEDPYQKILFKVIRALTQTERVEQKGRALLFKELKDACSRQTDPLFLCRAYQLLLNREDEFVEKGFKRLFKDKIVFDSFDRQSYLLDALVLGKELGMEVSTELTDGRIDLGTQVLPENLMTVEEERSEKMLTLRVRLRHVSAAPEVVLFYEDGMEFCDSDVLSNLWKSRPNEIRLTVRSFIPPRGRVDIRFYVKDDEARKIVLIYRDAIDSEIYEKIVI